MPLRHELRQMAVDERQQQRRDVVAVGVGVRQDDDLAVAQPRELEVLAEAAAERGDQIRQLLVLEHLRERRALRVEHLAAQRQNRLARAVAPLLGRTARRIALDDEQLAAFAGRIGAVAQLAGQVQARRRRALARDLGLRRAARFARARREDDARDDRFGHADVVVQPVLERRADDAVDRRHQLRVVQAILRLPLELRLLDEDAEHAGQPFADVLGA